MSKYVKNDWVIECIPDPMPGPCHHDDTQTNKPAMRDGGVRALSVH